MLAALVIVAIASVARSRPSLPVAGTDPSASLNVHAPPAVMSTLRRACVDCHSDETHLPWYAALPIASHVIERDVTAARGELNLSRWTQYNAFDRADMLDKMCQLASSGTMPPWQYRMMHHAARLSPTDVAALCSWTRDEETRLVQGEK
jgi:heme-binding protein